MEKKSGLKEGFVFVQGSLQEILWLKLNKRSNQMIAMVTSDTRYSAELPVSVWCQLQCCVRWCVYMRWERKS